MAWTDNLKNAAIKSAYVTASADATITYGEALTIFQSAASGGVTDTEFADLKLIYDNATLQFSSLYVRTLARNVVYGSPANTWWWGGVTTTGAVVPLGNLIAGYSELNYARLLDKWFLGKDLPMPIAGGDAATGVVAPYVFSYATATGPIFVNGVAASDIAQGYAGDCYLVASLGAIANAKPSVITSMVTDNGNGTYGIRFYEGSSTLYATVNLQLPVRSNGLLAFSGSPQKTTSGELWVALVEKGYVELNAQINLASDGKYANSYQAIEGGWASPLKQVANLNYYYYSSYYSGIPDSYKLGEYFSASAATYKQTIINALNAGEIGWIGTWGSSTGSNGKTNFVAGHAFMLLGYNAATDKFVIRNPWGDGGSSYNAQFEAPITEFWNSSVKGLVALTTGAQAPAYTYTITSNATAADPVAEGGTITFTITRSSASTAATVYVSTVAGTATEADYSAISKQAVSFAAYETTKTVTVSTLTDSLTEGAEYFWLAAYKGLADTTEAASALAYVKDAGTSSYTYSVTSSTTSAAPVTEGQAVTFTVTRSGSGSASTVWVSTRAGTAGDADYAALKLQPVTFASYETVKLVSVQTYVDALTEGTETFSLDLFKAQTDTTAAATGTGHIKDGTVTDYKYTVTSSATATAPVAEGGTVTFTITRSGSGSASTVYARTVNGTASESDYAAISGLALNFAPNETIKTVQVATFADWWLENTEYFDLRLYANVADPVGSYVAAATAYVSDTPVDPYNYTVTTAATSANPVSEGTPVTFTITRSNSGTASTVYVSTVTGTAGEADYTPLNRQAVTFAAYETAKTVTVTTLTDSLTEGTEYFHLNLYRNYTDQSYTAYATAYIKDFVAPSYSYSIASSAPSSSPVVEGGTITFTITRSGTGSASTVYVSTTPGTADASDYAAFTKQAVTFASYETMKTVTVNTLTDSLTEGTEYFWLDLYKNYSDTSYATFASGYIQDAVAQNYTYTVTSSAPSSNPVTEGSPITFTITRSGSGTASTVYVSTTPGTADASDYAAFTKQAVSFAANETVKTVTVNTLTDSLTEGTEYFWLDLYRNYSDWSYSTYASGYIKDAPTQNYSYTVTSSAPSSNPVTEGSPVTFTITRSGSGAASTVYVSTTPGTADASDYAAFTKQAVSFAANETVKTITVNTLTDSLTEGTEYFWLDLYKNYSDSYYTTFASAYIKDAPAQNYTYTVTSSATYDNPVAEGSPITFTITRSGTGTASTVYLSTTSGSANETDYAAFSRQALTFTANETVKTVTVNTFTDSLTEGTEYFWLDLFKNYADSQYATYATAYIKDNASPSYSYTITSSAPLTSPVAEGKAVTFTITRSGSGAASTVYVSTAPGSAGDADYTAITRQAVTFAANETVKTVSVNTTADTLVEGTEHFWLNLYTNYADSSYSAYAIAYITDPPVRPNPRLDMNGDGRADAIWQHVSGAVFQWNLNGTTVSATPVLGTVARDWSLLGIADFTGDGKADIAWRNAAGQVRLWATNGTGIVSDTILGTVASGTRLLTIGDFNGDGKADILWQAQNGALTEWLTADTTTITTASLGTLDSSWKFLGAGDFDGNGKTDLLWQHVTGPIFEWQMNGASIANWAVLGSLGPEWKLLGSGDLNGDGKDDLLWQHETGYLFNWEMNGLTMTGGGLIGRMDQSWSLAAMADYSGDGKADLLWRNTAGLLWQWRMDGTQAIGHGVLGQEDASWKLLT